MRHKYAGRKLDRQAERVWRAKTDREAEGRQRAGRQTDRRRPPVRSARSAGWKPLYHLILPPLPACLPVASARVPSPVSVPYFSTPSRLLVEDVNLLPVVHAGVEHLGKEVRFLLRGALLALHAQDLLSRGALRFQISVYFERARGAGGRNGWLIHPSIDPSGETTTKAENTSPRRARSVLLSVKYVETSVRFWAVSLVWPAQAKTSRKRPAREVQAKGGMLCTCDPQRVPGGRVQATHTRDKSGGGSIPRWFLAPLNLRTHPLVELAHVQSVARPLLAQHDTQARDGTGARAHRGHHLSEERHTPAKPKSGRVKHVRCATK